MSRSKSKPKVEFQYDGRANSVACHPRATCHIAGWKNCIQHIENRFPPYLIFLFFLKCSLGFGERRLSYRLQYTCYCYEIKLLLLIEHPSCCVRLWTGRRSLCPATMSRRLRSVSLDRYDDNRLSAEQRGGVGIGRRGSGSVRTSSNSVDGWTSETDVTDSAWRRTMESSSLSTNPG